MNTFPIIRIVTKILIPYILLFAFYVQFHGDFGPGGGFQAGVIFAGALILYGLVFGLDCVHKLAPPWIMEKLIAAGVLLYAGTGVVTMLLKEERDGSQQFARFLDYDVLHFENWPSFLPHGQHLGIFVVELGVGITVTAVMTIIFYAFAGRGQTE